MEEHNLVEVRETGAPIALSTMLRGPAAEVNAMVVNLKAELETLVERQPDNYAALALLGELSLRTGLKIAARNYLYRASLLRPPSWEAYQRTSLLLRRAEEDRALEVSRSGAPPPLWLRRAVVAVVGLARARWFRGSTHLQEARA